MFPPKSTVGIIIFAVCAVSGWAQRFAQITALGREADLVAFGSVDEIVQAGGTGSADVVLRLRLLESLKGTFPSGTILASVPARSPRGLAPAQAGADLLRRPGVWFLKSEAGGYRILPRVKDGYTGWDLFLPVDGIGNLERQSRPLDDVLLDLQVRWYRSLDHAKPGTEDSMLLSTFGHWNAESPSKEQVLAAVAPLISSQVAAEHAIGLTVALRAGSSDALGRVVDELPLLRSSPRFDLILNAIGAYYPKDPSSFPLLHRLLAEYGDVPGVDAAVGGALGKFGTKTVLPDMARLLDSKDSNVQLGTAKFFGVFTLLASADGEIHDSAPVGPFATEETRAYTPRTGSQISPSEYARWWKAWWAENRARLGFEVQ